MKKQKSQKSQPQSTLTAAAFSKWLRSIPQSSPDGKVTIQPPITLTQAQWAMLAVDAARQKVTLDELVQSSINTFVAMVQEDLEKAA